MKRGPGTNGALLGGFEFSFLFFNGLGVEDFGSGLGFSIFTQQYSWTFLDTDGAVLF